MTHREERIISQKICFNLKQAEYSFVEVMVSIVGTYVLHSEHCAWILRMQWHLCKDTGPRKKLKPRKEPLFAL